MYRKNYDRISQKSVRLFPEVKETLEKLKQQGVKIVLVSSKGEEALKKLLSDLEIEHYFFLIIGEEKMKEKKPSPFVMKEILKKQKLEPKEVLIVGDTKYDIQMGKNANCKTCAVFYGYGSLKEIKENSPDYTIKKFSDILNLIK